MSSVVLSSQRMPLGDALFSERRTRRRTSTRWCYDGQKLFPSVTRVFSKSRDLYVFLQAYERGATGTQPLVAFVTLLSRRVKVFETAPHGGGRGLDDDRRRSPCGSTSPLGGVAPGRTTARSPCWIPPGTKADFWRAPIVVIQ